MRRSVFASFPAHALGAFVGAFIAFVAAGSCRDAFAYTIGRLFLAGGIIVCFILLAPGRLMAVDLVGAYLPMARVATRLSFGSITKSPIGCQVVLHIIADCVFDRRHRPSIAHSSQLCDVGLGVILIFPLQGFGHLDKINFRRQI